MAKIQLIRPPLDDWYEVSQVKENPSLPIGLCLIAKNLREKHDVSIIDGYGKTLEEVTNKIDADIVGVSSLYVYHQNALAILKKAKSLSAMTAIGGPHIRPIPDRVLNNHDFIDYAFVGDAEDAFPMLCDGIDTDKIPNLVRKYNGRIKANYLQNASMQTIFDLDDILDVDFKNIIMVPISSIRGCIKAEEGERCAHCSIYRKLVGLMHPDKVWEQIDVLFDKHRITTVMESGDSFIVDDYPLRLLKSRPERLSHIEFGQVYANTEQVTPYVADVLRDLNVNSVFLGVESIDNNVLAANGKVGNRESAEKAMDILYQRGIHLRVAFMYGLWEETPESMEKTFSFARSIVETYDKTKILSSLAIPLPGSALFNALMDNQQARKEYQRVRKEYQGNLETDDVLNYQSLVRLNLKHSTDVTFDAALEYTEKTRNLVPLGRGTSFDINHG